MEEGDYTIRIVRAEERIQHLRDMRDEDREAFSAIRKDVSDIKTDIGKLKLQLTLIGGMVVFAANYLSRYIPTLGA